MARTSIVLDDQLVEQAMKLSGAKTKRAVVDLALRQLVARRSVYRALRRLKGKLSWTGDVDAWRRAHR
jgi:Arc/MetJ family transcription regulator